MKEYPNFYENLQEARRRIGSTVVLYDGLPYYVLAVSDYKPDGIFRVYLDPLVTEGLMEHRLGGVPYEWHDEPNKTVGHVMDKYLSENKDSKILRKTMNSPLFNCFRPFPLGMTNINGSVAYLTRMPTRPLTNQGLTGSGIQAELLDLDETKRKIGRGYRPNLTSNEMCRTILGSYPVVKDVIENLRDPDVISNACAFHREFAVLRGPVNTLFLAYKTDIIGILPNRDTSKVLLARDFSYCKEVTQELETFDEVTVE